MIKENIDNPKRIKVLHLQVLPILSGVQNMMLQLLSGMDNDKYDFYVASRGNGELDKVVVSKGWTHISIDSLVREFSFKDIQSALRIIKIIRLLKPDIVHTHSAKTGFLGRIIARLMGVKLVIHTTHGFPFHDYQHFIQKFFFILLETFAALFAHINVFVNNHEKEYAVHRLGYNRKKCFTIYNGIPVILKSKTYIDQSFTAPNPEANPKPLKIVSVLRFSKQKNIVATIEQAIKIVKTFDNIIFDFYGDGELFNICEKMVFDNQAKDRVRLMGWSFDVQNILYHYDVFLLNSLWEGLSISILEAMNVGVPILCSNIKGDNELVDSLNGWLVNPKDPNSFEPIFQEILNNRAIIETKGIESIKKVTNQFNYELFINEYERLYTNIKI
jgi:glycosyltransferase involved in cell wall biosynthesis